MALANWLQEEGRAVAILSRGYQRRSSGTQIVSKGSGLLLEWKDCGDEPAMIAQLTHGIPVVVDENRYRGGLKLIREFSPRCHYSRRRVFNIGQSEGTWILFW